MKDNIASWQIRIYGAFIVLVAFTAFVFPRWGVAKPIGILDNPIAGNSDLIYFATGAPDNFIIYSPGLRKTVLILPASERMADMVISPDGTTVWTATKAGFVDRYQIPIGKAFARTGELHRKIAPVLSAVELTANGRFIAVAYGNSEDYNARNIKILPADSVMLQDEKADFPVSGDIQDIVANPVKNLIYIINSHSDRVRIYNTDRFRRESDIIELGNSPGRFVVRPDGKKGYGAMNARQNIASVDLDTNQTLTPIPLGFPPYAMCFSEDGSHLYAASRDSSSIAVIDTNEDKVLKVFDLPPRLEGLLEFNFPEQIGISSDEKYFYVLPKRPELVIYDISEVMNSDDKKIKPVMVQSEVLSTTPFFMQVIRGSQTPSG
ncbi:MAG: YncE family protein [bacterium]